MYLIKENYILFQKILGTLNLKTLLILWNFHSPRNPTYCKMYISCFLMNLFTLITVVLVINLFLEDSFLTYGYDVCKYFENINGQVNPMEYLFPKMATCSYRAYGRSGSRENFSGQCILTNNVIHEKTFLILWFFYLFLFLLYILKIFERLTFICCTKFYIKKSFCLNNYQANIFLKKASRYDIMVLELIQKNLPASVFFAFMKNFIFQEEETTV